MCGEHTAVLINAFFPDMLHEPSMLTQSQGRFFLNKKIPQLNMTFQSMLIKDKCADHDKR